MTPGRALFVAYALALPACAAPAPGIQSSAPVAGPPKTDWLTHSLPAVGLRSQFPREPTEVHSASLQGNTPLMTRGFSAAVNGTELGCFVIRTDVPDRDRDRPALERYIKRVLPERDSETLGERDGWVSGTALGRNDSGKPMLLRASIAGRAFIAAFAIAKSGTLNRALADRFVDACRFTMPWNVRADFESGFTVAVPTLAIEMAPDHTSGMRHYFVGGPDNMLYSTIAQPKEIDDAHSDDERLDGALEVMGKNNRVILQSAVTLDGVRGRDVVLQAKGTFQRWQFFLTSTHLFGLGITAERREALSGDDARRFLKSIRWRIND